MYCKFCKKESGKKHLFQEFLTLNCGHTIVVPKFEMISSDGKTPMPFQYKGIQFAEDSNFRCLIGDEMGLGKTIQGLGALKKIDKSKLPVLILVKSSLKLQWFGEIVRWLGIDYLPCIIESAKDPLVEGFNVYIASYDILRRFSTEDEVTITTPFGMEVTKKEKTSPFYTFPFKMIIMDEVQSIKNSASSRTDEVERICEGKEHIIALSGTPTKNNAAEYYTILHILRPDLFYSKKQFIDRWVESYQEGPYVKYGGIRNPKGWKEYTKDFIIRRTREEVLPELPRINRMFHHVDFESDKLKKAYEAAEYDFIREMEKSQKGGMPLDPLGMLAKLRHIVGINKIQPTVERLSEFLLETDRKIVVFTHHLDVMEAIKLLITKWCLDGGYSEPVIYHAGLNSEQRNEVILKFKNDPNCRIFIASTLAASEGLNMQFCSDCILVERQFNPANEEQAEGRFIRIGQLATQVNATYMIASGTIDEWFTQLVEKKRAAMASTLDGKEVDWQESSLMVELFNVIMAKGRKKTKGVK